MYRFVLYLLSLAWGKKLFLCQDVLVLRSVASAWGEKRKQVVSRVRGVCEDVTCPLLHSGVVQVLKAGQGHTNYPFCCPNSPLQSSYIWFAGWHKPDSYRGAQNRLNNSRVKLWHMRLWQVEIFQLTKLSRVDVRVPFQVLGDGGTQESEWLHCSHSTVHDGEWGRAGGFLLKSTIISTVLRVLSSRLLWLHQTASCLTSCL